MIPTLSSMVSRLFRPVRWSETNPRRPVPCIVQLASCCWTRQSVDLAFRSIIPNMLPCRLESIALQERVRVVVGAVERTAR